MFPHRFDGPATAPAPAPAPVVPAPRRRAGAGRAALVALALVGTTLGGGVAGAVTATRLAPVAAATAASQPPSTVAAQPQAQAPAQPIAAQANPVANVAGSVFARVNPAVVQLVVSGQTAGGRMQEGSGSGFVVDAQGYILTNNHVVAGARTISVRFPTGETREATVLGTDSGNDLAVLKVDLPANAAVAPLGNSDTVEIGETAIAIGSPFGLDSSVTQGIVSAVNRTWQPDSGRVQRNLLQTDAPINPGNSGGPLLNARGEVIGINTMIESPIRGSVGVGFAVPINTAKQLLPQLEAGAKLEPVWLGISGVELDATIAADQNIPVQSGVLVASVMPNGPAARAGLRGGQGQNERIPRGGDVITAVNGQAVKTVGDISERLSGLKPGDQVTLSIVRSGQQQDLQVTLQAWPAEVGQ